MQQQENVSWGLFPRIAALPSAREWLQLQANRQLSPRTIEAYGRGLEDLLRFCEQQEPPLSVETATKGDLAAYVRDSGDPSQSPRTTDHPSSLRVWSL